MKKYLAKLLYWLATRFDDRWPKYSDVMKEDMMTYGNGFAKRIKMEDIYLPPNPNKND